MGDGGFDFAQKVVTLYGQGSIGRLSDSMAGRLERGAIAAIEGALVTVR